LIVTGVQPCALPIFDVRLLALFRPRGARREHAGDRPREAEDLAAEAAEVAAEGEGQEEDEEQHVELVHAPPPGAAQPRLIGLDGGAGRATEGALARGHRLLLPSHARLLVMLALAQLGQDAGLLTLLLEAADRALDGLVLLDPNPSHAVDSPPPRASGTRVFASRSRRSKERTIRQKW